MCSEEELITDMTIMRVRGGKVGVKTHETTIMSLAPRVGGDGPNTWRMYNMLNTHGVLFPGPIKLKIYSQPVLN